MDEATNIWTIKSFQLSHLFILSSVNDIRLTIFQVSCNNIIFWPFENVEFCEKKLWFAGRNNFASLIRKIVQSKSIHVFRTLIRMLFRLFKVFKASFYALKVMFLLQRRSNAKTSQKLLFLVVCQIVICFDELKIVPIIGRGRYRCRLMHLNQANNQLWSICH